MFQTDLDPGQEDCYTENKKSCVFPFRYNGISYHRCTLEQADEQGVAWCSTLVDENGNHVSGGGHYGNCGPNCPLPGRTILSH